jgi:hypothetical protein
MALSDFIFSRFECEGSIYQVQERRKEKGMANLVTTCITEESSPTEPYNNPYSKSNSLANIHKGQIKLLLNEIDFLTDFAEPGDVVVYAGAADGRHLPTLYRMFEHLHMTWHFYDPRPFHADTQKFAASHPRSFLLHNTFFTDETAAKHSSSPNALFISDIRSDAMHDSEIMRDMAMQRDWVEAMRPKAFSLKFRGAYEYAEGGNPFFSYLDGEMRVQPWAPVNSTELRLVGMDWHSSKEYSHQFLEEAMAYFNRFTRPMQRNDQGLQAYILGKYREAFKNQQDQGVALFYVFCTLYSSQKSKNKIRCQMRLDFF